MIREATKNDIPFIVKEGIKFLKYHPAKISDGLDVEYLCELANELIEGHVVLIAEKDGNPIGMIAGQITPVVFNPNCLILQELFWWMKEDHRNSLIAFKLYDAFKQKAKDLKIDKLIMVSTEYTPTLFRYYKKKGMRPVEQSFILEL